MIFSDKFSLYWAAQVMVLRCDVCNARDWGHGNVFVWDAFEDMNLAGLISRAQGHWAQVHTPEEKA